MAGERGYDQAATLTAGDMFRVWSHMRETCGLVATTACRDELIRQAVRQARAREVGEKVPPPTRPNRAALLAQAASTPAPTQQTGEG